MQYDDPYLQQIDWQILYTRTMGSVLEEKLDQAIESTEFPSENAIELANTVKKLLEVARLQLGLKYGPQLLELADTTIQNHSGTRLRLEYRILKVTQLVIALTPYIKFVRGSHGEHSPWGIVGQINNLCQKLHRKSRVIVHPKWEYNYSYYSLTLFLRIIGVNSTWVSKELSNAILDIVDSSPYFFSLSYPPTATENLLHMAIWGHEIGHFMDNIMIEKTLSDHPHHKHGTFDLDDWFYSSVLFRDFEETINVEEIKKTLRSMSLGSTSDSSHLTDEELNEISNDIAEPIAENIKRWAKELFADLFSIKLFGPAALLAFYEFVYPLFDVKPGPFHPPLEIRLRVLLDEYSRWNSDNPGWIESLSLTSKRAYEQRISFLETVVETNKATPLSHWHKSAEGQGSNIVFHHVLVENTDRFVAKLRQAIDEIASENEECFLTAHDMDKMGSAIRDLENSLPPNIAKCVGTIEESNSNVEAKIFAMALNAGWLHWLSKNYRAQDGNSNSSEQYEDERINAFKQVNKLLLKSISNAEACRWYVDRESFGNQRERRLRAKAFSGTEEVTDWFNITIGGVLARDELLYRIQDDNQQKRKLDIRPLLDVVSQVGTCSIDVRLSNEFIVTKRTVLAELDPTDLGVSSSTTQFYQKLYLPFGKPFVLHPGQFVLASTLEYIAIPEDLMGVVLGRSSLAHLGLVIANTFKVIPGFKGCITLELTNLGDAPILLYPCSRIAQIVVHRMRQQPETE